MRLTSNIIGCEGSRTVRVILFNVCCPIRFIIHGTFTSHSIEVSLNLSLNYKQDDLIYFSLRSIS
jgi:hypothetical protein